MKMRKLILTLGIIAAVSGILISVVNSFTAPIIQENQIKAEEEIILEFYPESTSFEKVETSQAEASAQFIYKEADNATSVTAYYTVYTDKDIVGYVYQASGKNGYGAVTIMMAIDNKNQIVGFEYLIFNQTPGFGDRVKTDQFISQFDTDVDSLEVIPASGATISSTLVTNLSNDVVIFHNELVGNGTKASEESLEVFANAVSFEEVSITDSNVTLETKAFDKDHNYIGSSYIVNESNDTGNVILQVSVDNAGIIIALQYLDYSITSEAGNKVTDQAYLNNYIDQKIDGYADTEAISQATLSRALVYAAFEDINKYRKEAN